MNSWREELPGFWVPHDWPSDRTRWPDYTHPDYVRALHGELPDIAGMLRFHGWGQPSRKAWGAWMGSYSADKPLRRGWQEFEMIADRRYDQARYIYLVPHWKRALTEVITAIDDIEDQLSTILWIAETVSRKWIPIPKGILGAAQKANTALDCAGKALGGVIPGRGAKSNYVECMAAIQQGKRGHREAKAGLVAWFQANWGRLLEAAQATGTWFDVGIVLGPIWGWIDEGVWGAVKSTANNYLIATEALIPGYTKWAQETDQKIFEALENAWDTTWGRGATIEYGHDAPEWAQYP